MAWFEAGYLVDDALSANLQAKLTALSVEAGDTAPTIADFRLDFDDDDPEGRDWPVVRTMLAGLPASDAELESFGKNDIRIPLMVEYETKDRDSAAARRGASYVYRSVVQVLNDLSHPSRNNVTLIQVVLGAPELGISAEGHVQARIPVICHMRDNSP